MARTQSAVSSLRCTIFKGQRPCRHSGVRGPGRHSQRSKHVQGNSDRLIRAGHEAVYVTETNNLPCRLSDHCCFVEGWQADRRTNRQTD